LFSNNQLRRFLTLSFGIMLAIGAWSSMANFAEARGGGHGGGGHRGSRGGGLRGGSRSFAHNSRRSFARNSSRRPAARNHHHFVNHHHSGRHHHRHLGPGDVFVDGPDGDFDSADGVVDGSSITLINPQESQRAVDYTLDSTADSLDPDQSTVYDGGTRVITFDRGGNFGQAQYTLQPGTYRFTGSDHGWELLAVTTPA
jgi:hypothetical protein